MSENFKAASSAWDIISKSQPLINALIDSLREGVIPGNEQLDALQEILTKYLSELDCIEALERHFGNFYFQDYSSQEASDDVMIEDALKYPSTIQILHNAALKKLISIDSSQDAVQWLIQRHYLTPVYGSSIEGAGLYGITSKGHRCLTEKNIRQKLCKDDLSNEIPAALCIPPDKWSTLSLSQATVLKRFFDQVGIEDYMVFPAPEHRDVLIGCEISSAPDIQYVIAWTDAPTVLAGWKNYVQEMISTPSVSHITVVCRKKEEINELLDAVKDFKNIEKIYPFNFEVSE